MTTIVGDYRRKILVADSQYTDDEAGIKYQDEKVYPLANGGWFAGAGHKSDIEKVLKWIKDGKGRGKPKVKNPNSFLMLTEAGLFSSDNSLEFETVKDFIAIGSGSMAAEALLRHGLTAEEAVKGACNIDLYSCEPIRVYKLGESNAQ
jgi:20S proteasome alpha/beta subunit